MLEIKQKTIQVAELKDGYMVEIHETKIDKDDAIEVWIYQKDEEVKLYSFAILKENMESPMKLYKHIEENMDEYIEAYNKELFED